MYSCGIANFKGILIHLGGGAGLVSGYFTLYKKIDFHDFARN
jgi:hypothetical protein